MVTGIGQYQIQFDISKARFTNGAIMVGDSVRVNYIGDLKEKKAKAVIVYLMPQKSNVVTAGFNPDAELETKPMTSEEKESFDKFVETAKKNRK